MVNAQNMSCSIITIMYNFVLIYKGVNIYTHIF